MNSDFPGISVDVRSLRTCSSCRERPVFFSETDFQIHDQRYHASICSPSTFIPMVDSTGASYYSASNPRRVDSGQWGEPRATQFVNDMSLIKAELRRNGNQLNQVRHQIKHVANHLFRPRDDKDNNPLVIGRRKKDVRRDAAIGPNQLNPTRTTGPKSSHTLFDKFTGAGKVLNEKGNSKDELDVSKDIGHLVNGESVHMMNSQSGFKDLGVPDKKDKGEYGKLKIKLKKENDSIQKMKTLISKKVKQTAKTNELNEHNLYYSDNSRPNNEKLTATVKGLREQVVIASFEKNALIHEIEAVTKDFNESKSMNATLKREIDTLKDEIVKTKKESKTTRKDRQLRSSRETICELERKNQTQMVEMENLLKEKENDLRVLKIDYDKVLSEGSRLEYNYDVMNRDLTLVRENYNNARSMLDETGRKTADLVKLVEEKGKETEDLASLNLMNNPELQHLQSVLKANAIEMDKKQNELTLVTKGLEDVNAKLERAEKENISQSNECETLKMMLKEADNAMKVKQETIHRLEASLKESMVDSMSREEKMINLSKELDKVKGKNTMSEYQCMDLKVLLEQNERLSLSKMNSKELEIGELQQKNYAMQMELTEAKKVCEVHEKVIEKENANVDEMENTIRSLSEQILVKDEELAEKKKVLESVEKILTAKEVEISNLVNEREESCKQANMHKDEANVFKKQLNDLIERRKRSSEDVLRSQLDAANEKLMDTETLKEQLNDALKYQKETEEVLKGHVDDAKHKQKEIDKLQKELAESKDKLKNADELHKQLDEANVKLKNADCLQKQLDEAKDELKNADDLQRQLDEAKKQLEYANELQKQLDEAKKQLKNVDELQKQLDEAKDELKNAEELQRELDEAKKQLRYADESQKQLEEANKQLKNVDELQKQLNASKDQLKSADGLQKQLEEVKDQLKNAEALKKETDTVELERQLKEALEKEKETEELKRQLSEATERQKETDKLRDQLNDAIEKKRDAEEELELSEKNVTDLSIELASVSKSLDDAKKEISSIEKSKLEFIDYTEELNKKKDECEVLKKCNHQLTNKLEEMKKDVERLEKEKISEKSEEQFEMLENDGIKEVVDDNFEEDDDDDETSSSSILTSSDESDIDDVDDIPIPKRPWGEEHVKGLKSENGSNKTMNNQSEQFVELVNQSDMSKDSSECINPSTIGEVNETSTTTAESNHSMEAKQEQNNEPLDCVNITNESNHSLRNIPPISKKMSNFVELQNDKLSSSSLKDLPLMAKNSSFVMCDDRDIPASRLEEQFSFLCLDENKNEHRDENGKSYESVAEDQSYSLDFHDDVSESIDEELSEDGPDEDQIALLLEGLGE